MATVLGHHPAFHMGACYSGPFEVSEYDVIGGYLGEPLRLVASETFGDDLLIPADAEVVIEGVLKPGGRVVEGPFGEAPGYLGPQRYTTCVEYEVKAINYRNGAMYQSVITPEGDKPWMDLPREGAYLRRCREAVPGVTAVCKQGRHAHYNVFISMKKMSEGDPGARRRRRVDLRSHEECLRLRRRYRCFQSDRYSLGDLRRGCSRISRSIS